VIQIYNVVYKLRDELGSDVDWMRVKLMKSGVNKQTDINRYIDKSQV